jgi:hypothetical protein
MSQKTQETFIPAIRSNIIESNSIASVFDHIDHHETLVIFDIDNTILESVNQQGSPQWVTALIKHAQDLGMNPEQAYTLIEPILHDVFMATEVKPVEPEIVSLIAQLQQQNIPVIGLTARSTRMVTATIKHLSSIALSLNQTSLSLKNNLEIAHLPVPHEAHYHEGVLYCGGVNPKGRTLETLLKSTSYMPEKIIFVDDQLRYLTSVETVAAELKIPFIGIHYTRLDEKVKNFVLDQESITRCFTSNL